MESCKDPNVFTKRKRKSKVADCLCLFQRSLPRLVMIPCPIYHSTFETVLKLTIYNYLSPLFRQIGNYLRAVMWNFIFLFPMLTRCLAMCIQYTVAASPPQHFFFCDFTYPWSVPVQKIKWKIPEINNSWVLSYTQCSV